MIRRYQSEDTDDLIAVWREANALAHPFLPDDFVARVAEDMRHVYLPNAETWVIEQNGHLIGFIALIGDEIGGLFVDPAYHGKGFGKALVDHSVALKGPMRVEVFKRNAIGRPFYERYGFLLVKEYQHEGSGQLILKMAMPPS